MCVCVYIFMCVYVYISMCITSMLSQVQLFVTLWIVARQAPLSMGFSRQEYCSGLPFPSPGDLSHPGIEPWSPTLQVDSLLSEPLGKWKNTGVDSLSLLQGILLTQEYSLGLLHCRWRNSAVESINIYPGSQYIQS